MVKMSLKLDYRAYQKAKDKEERLAAAAGTGVASLGTVGSLQPKKSIVMSKKYKTTPDIYLDFSKQRLHDMARTVDELDFYNVINETRMAADANLLDFYDTYEVNDPTIRKEIEALNHQSQGNSVGAHKTPVVKVKGNKVKIINPEKVMKYLEEEAQYADSKFQRYPTEMKAVMSKARKNYGEWKKAFTTFMDNLHIQEPAITAVKSAGITGVNRFKRVESPKASNWTDILSNMIKNNKKRLVKGGAIGMATVAAGSGVYYLLASESVEKGSVMDQAFASSSKASMSEEDKKSLLNGVAHVLKYPEKYDLTSEQAKEMLESTLLRDDANSVVLKDKLLKIGKSEPEVSLTEDKTVEATDKTQPKRRTMDKEAERIELIETLIRNSQTARRTVKGIENLTKKIHGR